jgi:hypothetical protein
VAGSHIRRGNSDPLRVPPAVGQFSQDSGGRALVEFAFFFVHNGGGGSSDGADVLQSEAPRTAIVGNVEDGEEQAASLAVEPGPAPGDADVLARESGSDAIHLAAPLAASEGCKVRPDRRRIERSRFHERDKLAGSRGFPFNVANGAVLDSKKLECGSHAFSEHPDAGAQFDGM